MKRVWLNINTGEFSNSWNDSEYPEFDNDVFMYAEIHGWKLIEYTCVNDTDFELCDLMKIVTSDKAKNRQRKKRDRIV